MVTREGIPALADLDALLASPVFASHRTFNAAFLQQHAPLLRRYARWWGRDPLSLWSRRWEYPFAAERVLAYARQAAGQALRMLDAGSGVTYLPFFLAGRANNLSIVCCDSNPAYASVIDEIARDSQLAASRVRPVVGTLQQLQEADGSFDLVTCVSVLEHTDRHSQIVDEFARVLKPGGLLVLTFDISLDGKFQLHPEDARGVIDHLRNDFDLSLDPAEFDRLRDPAALLTTDHCRRHSPHLLPFTHPWILAIYDLFRGYGWTGGFRSVAVMCVTGVRKERMEDGR